MRGSDPCCRLVRPPGLAGVLERLGQVVWIYERASGRFAFVSPAFAGVWGRPVESVDRSRWLEWVAPEDRGPVAARLDGAAGGTRFDARYSISRPDGRRRRIRERGVVLRSVEGAGRVVALAEDVTPGTDEWLPATGGERQVARAVAVELIGSLTAVVAHCRLAADALEADHRVREDVEGIARAAARIEHLTRRLRAFGDARPRLAAAGVEINGAIAGRIAVLRRIVGRGVDVVLRLDEGVGRVAVRAEEFEHILLGLATGAAEAMEGVGRLTIGTAGDAGSGRASLILSDTGTRLDAAARRGWFEPPFDRPGLDLSIVRRVVEDRHGRLGVIGRPGGGTTVRVDLPVVVGE